MQTVKIRFLTYGTWRDLSDNYIYFLCECFQFESIADLHQNVLKSASLKKKTYPLTISLHTMIMINYLPGSEVGAVIKSEGRGQKVRSCVRKDKLPSELQKSLEDIYCLASPSRRTCLCGMRRGVINMVNCSQEMVPI